MASGVSSSLAKYAAPSAVITRSPRSAVSPVANAAASGSNADASRSNLCASSSSSDSSEKDDSTSSSSSDPKPRFRDRPRPRPRPRPPAPRPEPEGRPGLRAGANDFSIASRAAAPGRRATSPAPSSYVPVVSEYIFRPTPGSSGGGPVARGFAPWGGRGRSVETLRGVDAGANANAQSAVNVVSPSLSAARTASTDRSLPEPPSRSPASFANARTPSRIAPIARRSALRDTRSLSRVSARADSTWTRAARSVSSSVCARSSRSSRRSLRCTSALLAPRGSWRRRHPCSWGPRRGRVDGSRARRIDATPRGGIPSPAGSHRHVGTGMWGAGSGTGVGMGAGSGAGTRTGSGAGTDRSPGTGWRPLGMAGRVRLAGGRERPGDRRGPARLRLLRLSSFRALKKDADLVAGRRRRERVLRRGDVDGLRWRSDVRGDTRGDGLGGPGGPGPGGGMDARVHPCLGRENRAVRDPPAGLCGGRDEAEGSLWRGNGRFRPTVSLRGGYVARGTGESDIQATDGGSRAQSGRDVSQANITRRKRG